MKIEVFYMSGAGNLFSVIDNRNYKFTTKQGNILAPILCSKNEYNDFNAEGLMFLENDNPKYDFTCKFFNPDGSTGMMCGNGGRAITRFAELNQLIKNKDNINFFMSGNNYRSEITNSDIKLYMPPAEILPYKKVIELNNKKIEGYYSNTGTHHFVVNTEDNQIDFDNFDVKKLGSELRYCNEFKPDGSNINFIKIEENKVFLRTYEKGVEAETGACGTGAVATALTVNEFYNLEFPIEIIPTSKERLIIDKVEDNGEIVNMILQGPAKILYTNNILIPENLISLYI